MLQYAQVSPGEMTARDGQDPMRIEATVLIRGVPTASRKWSESEETARFWTAVDSSVETLRKAAGPTFFAAYFFGSTGVAAGAFVGVLAGGTGGV